jgi:hypothetical protein
MPSEDKQILLHRIAKVVIRLTHKYHKEDRDIVGELYDNSLAISQIIGQEMERIRLKERGGKL